MGGAMAEQNPKDPITSRRQFLGATTAVVSGVAAVAAKVQAAPSNCASAESVHTSQMFRDSLAAAPTRAEFGPEGVSGAQVFANLCQDENLAAMFLAPGNYTITNEIAQVGIPTFGGRSEGSMCAMADGFARMSGEIAACSGTEGPGFAHMIMNIAAAHAANTPLLVLASNVDLACEDSYLGMQYMQQQVTTTGIKKWGKRITMPERIYEYGSYAFRQLKTGIPGVVHLDFPDEVADARYKDSSTLSHYYDKNKYRTESRPTASRKDLANAVQMINKASRPVLIAGHGVHLRKAWEPLMRVSEKQDIAIVTAGPVRGNFPEDHRLSADMANDALMSADLIVFVGQYLMPSAGEWTFPPGIPTIEVGPETGSMGHVWPVDLGINSDELFFLQDLSELLPPKKRDSWVAEIAAARAKWTATNDGYYKLGLGYSEKMGVLHPAVIGKDLHDFLYKGKLDPKQTVAGYGGNTAGSYAGRWLRAFRPAQMTPTYYQFGAMGPDLAVMMGASAAVQLGIGPQAAHKGAPVFCMTGDAGMAYSLFELDTAQKYKLPTVCLVYNNDVWGTYTTALQLPRALQMYAFQEDLRYDKIAEVFGARGEYCKTSAELKAALQRSYDAAAKTGQSTIINCKGHKDFSQGSKYPPGIAFAASPGVGSFQK
jgi:thiamine pyrophosphate-dependent acetolactate synthase large subunit-like protein